MLASLKSNRDQNVYGAFVCIYINELILIKHLEVTCQAPCVYNLKSKFCCESHFIEEETGSKRPSTFPE